MAGVAANVQILEETTVLGLLQRFEHMIGYRSKKTFSLANCEFVVGGVASTYRMRVLRKVGFYDTDTLTEDIGLSAKITSLGNRRFRMVYGADVVAKTEGVLTLRALAKQRYRWKFGSLQNLIKYRGMILNPSSRYTRTLTYYRMPMAMLSEFTLLVSPLAWTYAVHWSLVTQTPALIIGAYATITAYTLLTVWMDENLTVRERAPALHLRADGVLPVLHHGPGAADGGASLHCSLSRPVPASRDQHLEVAAAGCQRGGGGTCRISAGEFFVSCCIRLSSSRSWSF